MGDISNYEKIRENAQDFYEKIGRVRCPAFNNDFVHFNAEGFNHLVYKRKRRERKKEVQIMKFKLLQKAKNIVEIATTYQEYDESLTNVRKKKRKKTISESATARYWGLIAIIKGIKVKVIVRQVGNGQKHFWSVIPAWSKSNYRDIKLIAMSKGDLKDY